MMKRRESGHAIGSGGFTLVELMVALAIVGFALAVVPSSVTALRDSMQYRAAVADVLSGLRAARTHAMRTGREAAFTLDIASHELEVVGRASIRLPDALQLGLVTADTERLDQRGSIRFYPDGSSTGGTVVILRPGGQGVRMRVDWLLGRVTQERLE